MARTVAAKMILGRNGIPAGKDEAEIIGDREVRSDGKSEEKG